MKQNLYTFSLAIIAACVSLVIALEAAGASPSDAVSGGSYSSRGALAEHLADIQREKAAQDKAAADFPAQLDDARGLRLTIPSRPCALVSLAPSLTEMLFAIGAGDRVAGVTRWCDEPPEARSLPKVGDVVADPEAIISLVPDLVVVQSDFNPKIVNTLESLGIRVLSLEVVGIGGITRAVRLLGRAVGERARAESLAAGIEARIAKVSALVPPVEARPRVYVEIWGSPPMAAGGNTFMEEIVDAAGGKNLFADTARGYFPVSLESVVARDPQAVLLLYPGASAKEFASRPCFSFTSAVRGGKIHLGDIGLFVRPGPRVAQAVEDLARRIHPALFPLEEGGIGRSDGK